MKNRILTLFFLCSLVIAQATDSKKKMAIAQSIQSIYNQKAFNHSSPTQLSCLLSPQERAKINSSYNKKEIYAYATILRELNTSQIVNADINNQQNPPYYDETPKISQDILMENARDSNPAALLLGLQLYFSKKCQRCDKIQEWSKMGFYYKRHASFIDILESEGLTSSDSSFLHSYVFRGEAFLCKALTSRDPLDFLFAYIHLSLAGIHTRAINILLEGLKQNTTISYGSKILLDTFLFLSSHDFIMQNNYLAVLALQHRIEQSFTHQRRSKILITPNILSLIQSLPNFKNILVLEYNVGANFILTSLLIKDMESKKILSPLHKLSNTASKKEFFAAQYKYTAQISHYLFNLLPQGTFNQLQTYYKILSLKKKLKQASQYPYAKRYIESNYEQ
ncbi:hypothetical protein CQA66_03425 [Helicobacter aurati]|uniref:Sel1 repeat family protein n=1 Tax=Helicobacter aurati TaxID=137778 RepID=A0A3D8J7V0_9HELI|nr:hypothetical protein [Helicobacter aurati]RDU72941.1 hypothetical protein CQA66_03425 [Helicobacter aurati]